VPGSLRLRSREGTGGLSGSNWVDGREAVVGPRQPIAVGGGGELDERRRGRAVVGIPAEHRVSDPGGAQRSLSP